MPGQRRGRLAIGEAPEDGAGTSASSGPMARRSPSASSAVGSRRWAATGPGGGPRRAKPTTSSIRGHRVRPAPTCSATAFSSSAVDAEVLAKSLLIAGRDDAIREAGRARAFPACSSTPPGRDHPRGVALREARPHVLAPGEIDGIARLRVRDGDRGGGVDPQDAPPPVGAARERHGRAQGPLPGRPGGGRGTRPPRWCSTRP